MKLIVWNSQGSKWNTAYKSFTSPLVKVLVPDDVVLLLVEAGWAPWMASGDVSCNARYWLDSAKTYYDAKAAGKSTLCRAVKKMRRRRALWVPWVGNLDAMKTNTRCSIGGAVFPRGYMLANADSCNFDGFIRPIIRLQFGKGTQNVNVSFTILVVHMISGYFTQARRQLIYAMNKMEDLIPQGSAALIVGDMNVDLLKAGALTNLPPHWKILRTGVATQQSGGELDFGLLYDRRWQLQSSNVTVVQQYKTGANKSDHSVLRYNIPLL